MQQKLVKMLLPEVGRVLHNHTIGFVVKELDFLESIQPKDWVRSRPATRRKEWGQVQFHRSTQPSMGLMRLGWLPGSISLTRRVDSESPLSSVLAWCPLHRHRLPFDCRHVILWGGDTHIILTSANEKYRCRARRAFKAPVSSQRDITQPVACLHSWQYINISSTAEALRQYSNISS